MGFCTFTLRIGFLAFFALNAWNILQNHEQHTSTFKSSYKNFEASIKTRTGFALPDVLGHAHVSTHSALIVKGLAWATLGLSALALLLSSCLTSAVGLLYFTQQVIHLNVANFSGKTSLVEFEKLALAVALLMGSFALSCGSKGSCGKKGSGASDLRQTGSSVDKNQASQSVNKKRH